MSVWVDGCEWVCRWMGGWVCRLMVCGWMGVCVGGVACEFGVRVLTVGSRVWRMWNMMGSMGVGC